MGKRVVLVVIQLILFSFVAFAFDYWYMDLYVYDSQRRAYFFRNFKTMEEAMGIPQNYEYRCWESGTSGARVPEYTRLIFTQMRKENFYAAFVYWDYKYNKGEYWYLLYLRQNDRNYCDFYITKNPVNF